MRPVLITISAVLIAVTAALSDLWWANARLLERPWSAPELTHRDAGAWINSEPLTLRELQGKVVLIDFWALGCWNCSRSFPWLRTVEERFAGQDFIVVGVHTPEFEHEKERSRVEEKVREFDLNHPIMLDNDLSYWNAMRNRYWPAFYLIDKAGQVRAYHAGEIHVGDDNARAIEQGIERLLQESL